MNYEVLVASDFDEEEQFWGESYQIEIEAENLATVFDKARLLKGPIVTILWIRDDMGKVLYYADESHDEYEYGFDRQDCLSLFPKLLKRWPDTINVSQKEWTEDRSGCLIFELSDIYHEIDDEICDQAERKILPEMQVNISLVLSWLIFGILHDRAKTTEHWITTQDICFEEIECEVKRAYLGWKHEKPAAGFIEVH
ncbi:hypothetical protein KFE96_18175 [Kordiimonas sp. SCSIO 12603]|uniref:hypothetical protein n=1 Tax=Kordiimonas sp. SCSIO 12603 TaxID=2829596 RepID=UPI0021056CF0|nr:hypothetical protein [Kordiimonas sp. SCSIO 12603]UTW58714.1 hypothetical protein KFE96_18175 [Kordiimonas sp. SCSIO 12603]